VGEGGREDGWRVRGGTKGGDGEHVAAAGAAEMGEEERRIAGRREGVEAYARDAGGWGGRRGEERNPWKSRGESAPLPLPPLPADPPRSSARAAVDVFREEKPSSCESVSGDRCTPHVEAISARGRKKERTIYIYI